MCAFVWKRAKKREREIEEEEKKKRSAGANACTCVFSWICYVLGFVCNVNNRCSSTAETFLPSLLVYILTIRETVRIYICILFLRLDNVNLGVTGRIQIFLFRKQSMIEDYVTQRGDEHVQTITVCRFL